MLIARTLEESERFIEQEESHILRLEAKPLKLSIEGTEYLIDNENQKLVVLPEHVKQKTIRTKKYGTLCLFDRIGDLLNSKYNKGVLAVYCGSVSSIKRKRTTNVLVNLSTFDESYEFEDKEFSPSGGVYLNNVEKIEPQGGYLVVVERNKHTANGCVVIDNFRLKSNG